MTEMLSKQAPFNQAQADKICELMVKGKNLKEICSMNSMPSMPCVLSWLSKVSEFATTYARSREIMLDNYGTDEIIDLADNAALTAEAINKARLQIDTRKWVMSKLLPRKYGDNAVLTHTGKVEIEQLVIQRTPKTIEHNIPLPIIDAPIKE